jgi:hypothetical protein
MEYVVFTYHKSSIFPTFFILFKNIIYFIIKENSNTIYNFT